MAEVRTLSADEESLIARLVQELKNELDRVDPPPPEYRPTTGDYLKSLAWTQYEGVSLHLKSTANLVFPTLLLIAEHLRITHGFFLRKYCDLLVLAHPGLKGFAPLEMLAFRPLQPNDGRWLDEDDPIDRALAAVEKVDVALGRGPNNASDWLELLLGKAWLWAMQHPATVKL